MSSPSQSVEEQQIHGSVVVFEDPLPLPLTPIHIEPPFNPDLDPADGEEGGGGEQERQKEPEEQKQESPRKPLIQMGVTPKVVPPIAAPDVRVSGVRRVPRYNYRKYQRKNAMTDLRDQQSVEQKLETLKVNFKPIPFIPVKILDFSKREKLLRKLGLWDFVHIDFDRTIRADLIGQLVVTYDPRWQRGQIDNFNIMLNRCNYAFAFKLPRTPTTKKNRGIGVEEAEDMSEDSIGFILEFVSNWILLHEDAWMTPSQVTNWLKLIKEGRPDMVDWAGLLRFMVEKELRQGVQLRDCYYASHIQYLLKYQHESLFTMEEDLVAEKLEVEAETKEEEKEINEEQVMAGSAMVDDQGEKCRVVEAQSIELTLGQDGEMTDVEKCKVDGDGGGDVNDHDDDEVREELGKEQGQWLLHGKNNLGEHFLQPSSVKDGQGFGNLDDEAGQSFANLEDGKDDEEEETEADGGDQVYDSQERLHDPSSVDTRDNMQCMDPSASFFNSSGKRVIEHDTGIDHHSVSDSNKRLRINESWNHKPRDFNTCMKEVEQLVEQSMMLLKEREHALGQATMNQQILLNELQKRDSLIDHLHKSRMEEIQKKDGLIHRLEENVMDGYRKALKETQSAFAEYRQRAQLTEEPTLPAPCPGSRKGELFTGSQRADVSVGSVQRRVMNAAICRAIERKKAAAQSGEKPEGSSAITKTPSPGVEAPLSPRSEVVELDLGKSIDPEVTPIHQVRAERPMGQCRSKFTDMYRDELRIVGVGPTPLAGSVLRDMLSLADALYVKNLGWHELVERSNTAAAEAAVLNAEVSSRASLARKQSIRDSKNYEITTLELEKNLKDLKLSFEKEKANSRSREEDMRMGFQAELLKLQNELQVAKLRLEASQGELKGAHEQLSEATQELDGARAELAKRAEGFKEAFLKSDEFFDIVAEKVYDYLAIGFKGCTEQFQAAGYPPKGTPLDFIDVDKYASSLFGGANN